MCPKSKTLGNSTALCTSSCLGPPRDRVHVVNYFYEKILEESIEFKKWCTNHGCNALHKSVSLLNTESLFCSPTLSIYLGSTTWCLCSGISEEVLSQCNLEVNEISFSYFFNTGVERQPECNGTVRFFPTWLGVHRFKSRKPFVLKGVNLQSFFNPASVGVSLGSHSFQKYITPVGL